ncbi:hypothetical protein CTA1_6103 [Colletotrichum tanaceti]|uniref:Uncharacterized protein n=1 Tax=Colletotrichum tanaceti TaxID=1306861 RepID=A0A4U6XBY7_9PEZI|nr:hypothetical protein CTA1_6103 [Colletotrichum tanaceti]
MPQLDHEPLLADISQGGQRILAWVVAAGLILAFSLLAPEVPRSRERAFYNNLRVLNFLGHGIMSPASGAATPPSASELLASN